MKRSLFCLLLALSFQAPAQDHPRLWVGGADVQRLRGWAVDSNPLYRDGLKPLAERAKGDMDRGDVPRRDCGSTEYEAYPTESYAQLFAFMSLVENDAAVRADYAGRSRTLLMGIIAAARQGPASEANYVCPENQQTGYAPFRSPRFFTEDSNRARWHGEAFPLVVDWIYPVLTAADKAAIREVFLRWSQEIVERGYHHPVPVGLFNSAALLNDRDQLRWAGNNYFTAHMRNLGMMALSLDAADDSGNQLRHYLDHATGAWLYLFDHLSRTDARGGLLPEGYEYSPQTASYAIQFLLALRTAGADTCGSHCRPNGNPFWDDFVTAFYHSLSPATTLEDGGGQVHQPAWYGDGENYHTSDFISAFGAMGAYDILDDNLPRLQSLRWAQTHSVPGGAAGFVRRVANPDDFRHAILYFMLFDPAAAAASDPRPALALDFHAAGLNTLLSRTDWSADASWFSYSLGWNLIDHQQANANNFEWYRKGEWLTKARNGYPNIAEGIAASEFRNVIALQNHQPARDSSDWRTDLWQRGSQWNLVAAGDPQLLASSANAGYLYALGDATQLYNSANENATDIVYANRSIVWLKPDVIVVMDRARSTTADRFKRWWLQLASPAVIAGNRASATTSGGQQLQVTSLLPAGAVLNAVNSTEASVEQTVARHEPMRVRLRIDAPGNPQEVRFLHVLQAGDAGVALPAAQLVQSQDQAYSGAQVGATVVMLPNSVGSAVNSLTYTTVTAASSHVITGLAANSGYTASIAGNTLTLRAGGVQVADIGGVLRVGAGATGTPGVFSGPLSSYAIGPTGSGFSVTDLVGTGGTVEVGTMSRLQFKDGWVALDIDGSAGKVYRLYQAAFDRKPDLAGLGYHLWTIESAGLTLSEVARNFFNSDESAAKYANTSNLQFMTRLYTNILHRTPDPAGLAYWVDVLDRGASRAEVLKDISGSAENVAGTQADTRNGIAFLAYRP